MSLPSPTDPYRELALAIVVQACSDYTFALAGNNRQLTSDCERFFRSEWFRLLVDDRIDGERVIEGVRRQHRQRMATKRRLAAERKRKGKA